jgi:hypothetical protein
MDKLFKNQSFENKIFFKTHRSFTVEWRVGGGGVHDRLTVHDRERPEKKKRSKA